MIRPLKALDYVSAKRLFYNVFSVSEDTNFQAAWRFRDPKLPAKLEFMNPLAQREGPTASFGLWDRGTLIGAAIVRGTCLEYIFLDESRRGGGNGTALLNAVLEQIPAIHLTPVNRRKLSK